MLWLLGSRRSLGVGGTYRSKGGIERPVAEALLQEKVELLLHKALHCHPVEGRRVEVHHGKKKIKNY